MFFSETLTNPLNSTVLLTSWTTKPLSLSSIKSIPNIPPPTAFDVFSHKSSISFLVTGSARLDYYRKGGDSLQGRYHYHRLHPFSLYELNSSPTQSDLDTLLKFGGYPEPLLAQSETEWKRWQRERVSRVIKEDLVTLEQVKEVSQLEVLAALLQEKVGSLLSINSLREDVSASHEAVDRWVTIFENLYFCFRIRPYGPKKINALKKDRKLFLWDWSLCVNPGPRFENMVASNLLKYCHFHVSRQVKISDY